MSCIRLDATASHGSKKAICKIVEAIVEPNSSPMPKVTSPTVEAVQLIRVENKQNHQNSDLVALPLKVRYLLKQADTDCRKFNCALFYYFCYYHIYRSITY
jgi:hypothetical protein